MRRISLAFVAVVAVGAVAWFSNPTEASELRVSIVQGANIRTFTGTHGGKYSVQCPTDGGSGQKVIYRPGCPTRADAGVLCVVDAGNGDVIMDFQANADPYQIDLAPNEDRFHMANAAGYAAPIYCNVFRRAP